MQNHYVFLCSNKRKFRENHNGSVCLSDLASWHLLSIRRRHFRFCEQNCLSKLVKCHVILKTLLSIWWAQLFSGSNAGSCWFCQIHLELSVRVWLLGARCANFFPHFFLNQNRKLQLFCYGRGKMNASLWRIHCGRQRNDWVSYGFLFLIET